MDRCSNEDQLHFINVLKNIFFRLENIFFIVCCNTEVLDNHINLSTNESYSNKIFAHTIKITNLSRFDLKKQNNEFYAEFFNKYYNDLLDCEGYRTLEKLIIKTKQNIFFDPEDDYTFVNDYIFYLNFLKTYNKEKFEWLLNNSKKVVEQDNLKSYFIKKLEEEIFNIIIFYLVKVIF